MLYLEAWYLDKYFSSVFTKTDVIAPQRQNLIILKSTHDMEK